MLGQKSKRLLEIDTELDYNKDNVTTISPSFSKSIAEAKELLGVSTLNMESRSLYYKIAIHELFCNRDMDQSLLYLGCYLTTLEIDPNYVNSFEYAEALNLIGHAKTIDPAYDSLNHFKEAKKILKPLVDEHGDADKQRKIRHEIAFAARYIGLAHHRHANSAKDADLKNDNCKKAQKYFNTAIEKFAENAGNEPCIQHAEAMHLLGASYSTQGDQKSAIEKLEAAIDEENKYILKHGSHFMLFTSLQNLAFSKRLLALQSNAIDSDRLLTEAAEHLQKAEDGQKLLFPVPNLDFAKTLQFAGDVYTQHGLWELAATKYIDCLILKLSLTKDRQHRAVTWTLDEIDKLVNILSIQLDQKDLSVADRSVITISMYTLCTRSELFYEKTQAKLLEMQRKILREVIPVSPKINIPMRMFDTVYVQKTEKEEMASPTNRRSKG